MLNWMIPSVSDKFDDLPELVLDHGGEVIAIPGGLVPFDTGLAVIDRY